MAAMKKIQAKTLEEAYRLACESLGCSMKELQYEVIQYPRGGFLGLFAKPAVIVASCTKASEPSAAGSPAPRPEAVSPSERSSVSEEEAPYNGREELPAEAEEHVSEEKEASESALAREEIVERFFDEEARETLPSREPVEAKDSQAVQEEIEKTLRQLFDQSCYDMEVIEVDVIDDTAYVFLDGEDAALIIGKEGYRYNALSYLLFNWLHGRYNLYLKLEVAEFLTNQQQMIRHKLQPVIEHVKREGWGRTRPLDGILVQIALEQLREAFPDKYVAIKRQRNGERYVLINEFNNSRRQ